uniref:hypothetical protein n=1 Tax=Marinobacter sp. TaxID=50741 RepID=UPI0035C6E348
PRCAPRTPGQSRCPRTGSLNKLATLGIVKKIATTRKINGGKGANIIVILPVDDQSTMSNRVQAEKPTETTTEAPKTENEPSDSIKRSKNQNNVLDTATVPAEALKGALPDEIFTAMSRYFGAEDIYKYYGILLRAKASVDRTIRLEEHAAPFIEAWHATIMKAKSHEIRRFDDYLYAGFRKAAWTVMPASWIRVMSSATRAPSSIGLGASPGTFLLSISAR